MPLTLEVKSEGEVPVEETIQNVQSYEVKDPATCTSNSRVVEICYTLYSESDEPAETRVLLLENPEEYTITVS